MKYFFSILTILMALAGCNAGQEPKDIVSTYLKAIDSFDFEKANSLLQQNAENRSALEEIKKYSNTLSESQKQALLSKGKNRIYNIIDKGSTETTASIIATNNEGNFTSVISFELVKENGQWFIKTFKADAG